MLSSGKQESEVIRRRKPAYLPTTTNMPTNQGDNRISSKSFTYTPNADKSSGNSLRHETVPVNFVSPSELDFHVQWDVSLPWTKSLVHFQLPNFVDVT